jgi:putative pyruvate formate lyase activating enzyme
MAFKPAYKTLFDSGSFPERVEKAKGHLSSCTVCPLVCQVNRLDGEIGECRISAEAVVSSYGPHHGEEDPLRGWRGSGTIFFSGCNLHCQFCQNASISQSRMGQKVSSKGLAEMMLTLQRRGCHNINFVSPTHVGPQIIEAVFLAAQEGLNIPLVYNTGGYDSMAMLKLFSGIVDIYMPDMKYADPQIGERYSQIAHYPAVNRRAVKEMHRQVGDLTLNAQGVAERGLLVRHLVLPNQLAGSEEVLRFIAEEISLDTYINLMDQYRPCYRAHQHPELNRRIHRSEYQEVASLAAELGLKRGDRH